METRFPATLCTLLLTAALAGVMAAQTTPTPSQAQDQAPPPDASSNVLTTTVRRVVLDVIVTDSKDVPVSGLTKDDFNVTEDNKPQQILSFEANGFSSDMDYVPTQLPPQPPNTFINMPSTPEKGPLYILLYDLVNMDDPGQMNSPEDHSAQLIARKQLLKFIQSKPEGTRFAIFVRSDGLHLIQGFTSDRSLLYAAVDPHSPKPHIPVVFLMGPNFGSGDRLAALDMLHALALYVDGLPGRKNLIWFSSQFPLQLFAADTDGPSFQEETKATLELLAQNQIAVYPVDARGTTASDSRTPIGASIHSDTVSSTGSSGSGGSGGGGRSGGGGGGGSTILGSSAVMDSYSLLDGIAKDTGGEAFYSNNDLAAELVKATENGSKYYTLTYSPTNRDYDSQLRNIKVALKKKGYDLSYRRFYYATDTPVTSVSTTTPAPPTPVKSKTAEPSLPVVDTLSANMQCGAPAAHQLVFIVKAQTEGAPQMGTPAQMADLSTEPAYFKSRRKSAQPHPLPPILLQKTLFSFNIPTRQFKNEPALNLEVAVAAYNADGLMMNAIVNITRKDLQQQSEEAPQPGAAQQPGTSQQPGAAQQPGASAPPRFFRIEQELEVPVGATTARFAVRDSSNDRTGAMQISLPLAPEAASR
jgi:VWFA-related protein